MRLITFLTLITFSTVCFSQTVYYTLDDSAYIHINGINTKKDDAKDNALKLSKILDKPVDLAYNETDGILTDLLEVARQEIHSVSSLSLNDFLSVLKDDESGKNQNLSILQKFREIKATKAQQSAILKDKNFYDLAASVLQAKGGKSTTVLLPHSQGNFYAQEIYKWMITEQLLNKDSIGIFGFGTPTSSYPNKHYDYISNSNDTILNRLRFNPITINITNLITALIDPLKANFDIPISSEDLSGHSLTETYLSSRSKAPQYAKEKILKMADNLEQHQFVTPPIGVFVSIQAVGENGSETPGFWLSTPSGISTGRPLSRAGQGHTCIAQTSKKGNPLSFPQVEFIEQVASQTLKNT